MSSLTKNPSEIKLLLFRYIDTMPEKKLQQFYDLLMLNKEDESYDFWDSLSDWEKEDINAGISDLENGKFKKINDVLAKN